jgi:hypothetical protein
LGHNVAGRIRSIRNYNEFTGKQTHAILAFSIVLPPTILLHALYNFSGYLSM